MNGVVVIDKPAGPTSFDVVRRVRSLLRVKKAGHTGTLDPMATGVLPICIGEATKIAGMITEGDKSYDAVIKLGSETDTQDAMGVKQVESPVPLLDAPLLEAALGKFRGTFAQIPPMYSAVKIAGKRLYELARAGEEVERAPRQVTVYELLLRDFSADELTLSVRCSKGFFVRTLAFDLGRQLGCGAHLKALRRTQSGPFSLNQSISVNRLIELCADRGEAALQEVSGRLVSVSDALAELPALTVSAADAARVKHGVPLETRESGRLRVFGPDSTLLAIADAQAGRLKYVRVFA